VRRKLTIATWRRCERGNGIVGRNGVELPVREQQKNPKTQKNPLGNAFGPERVIPARAGAAFAGFCLRDGGGEAFLDFGDGRRAVEANSEPHSGQALPVAVRVVWNAGMTKWPLR